MRYGHQFGARALAGYPLYLLFVDLALALPHVTRDEESVSPLLRHLGVRSDALFKALLEAHPYPERATVLEVGARDSGQSRLALELGFTTHVWEPSPHSYRAIVHQLSPWIAKGMAQVHPEAASSRSGLKVHFKAAKTRMSAAGDAILSESTDVRSDARSQTVMVSTIALDQAIVDIGLDQAFFVKIDVQGHEAHVLQGLSHSLSRHAFDYVMIEWWPKEMEQPAHQLPGTTCTAAAALRLLAQAGYTLFELQVKSRHYANTEVPLFGERFARPLGFDALCEWYKMRGHNHPQPTKMGYWTDFLAVAPNTKLDQHLSSLLGNKSSSDRQPGPGNGTVNGKKRKSFMAPKKFELGLSMEDGI
mmetsp:Transcript_11786/g.25586  ORF Transcript_11786/g.25586 Transcript_11786/m.25586 type:complete len:361 (-) Transcript_11786:270-1352(-)